MASEAADYREDVEQARRRFVEFRQAHAVRSRLLEELWAMAAKLARRDGITATARVLGVDRPSFQKWRDRLEPRASTKSPESPRRHRRGGKAAPAFVELLAASTATATGIRSRHLFWSCPSIETMQQEISMDVVQKNTFTSTIRREHGNVGSQRGWHADT